MNDYMNHLTSHMKVFIWRMKEINYKPTQLSIAMKILHIKINIWQIFPLQLLTRVQELVNFSTNEAKVHLKTTQSPQMVLRNWR